MSAVYCLVDVDYDEDDNAKPIVLGVSSDKHRLKREIDRLCEPYEQNLAANRHHDQRMKGLMRAYLVENRAAIDGFEHRGFGLKRGDALLEEQDGVINFLVNNWTYSMRDFAGSNSFVAAYCNVAKLSRPFPELIYFKADPCDAKGRVYARESLSIVKGKVLT